MLPFFVSVCVRSYEYSGKLFQRIHLIPCNNQLSYPFNPFLSDWHFYRFYSNARCFYSAMGNPWRRRGWHPAHKPQKRVFPICNQFQLNAYIKDDFFKIIRTAGFCLLRSIHSTKYKLFKALHGKSIFNLTIKQSFP